MSAPAYGAHLALPLALAVFTLTLTLFAQLSRMPSPVWDDAMETWAWGRQLELGYYKHPPMTAWVARAWFEVFPRADWSAYLLAACTGALGLIAVGRIAGLWLSGYTRLAAVLLPMLTIQHTIIATNFNANTILLAAWPWTVLAFLSAVEAKTWRAGAWFGVMVAVALLSKYVSVVLVGACLLAAVAHPDRKAIFTSPAPYVAALVAALLLVPHVAWLIGDGQAIGYAVDRMAPSSKMSKPLGALSTMLGSLAMLAPAAFALTYGIGWLSLRPGLARLGAALRQGDRLWLWVLGVAPFVLIVGLGLAGLFKIQPNFLIPAVFMLPTLVLAGAGIELKPDGFRRLTLVLVLGAITLLGAAPVVAWTQFAAGARYTDEPVQDVALKATELWHKTFGTPLKLVTGTEVYSLGLAFYSPDRPAEFTHFDPRQAPWVTPERMAREGLLIVCLADDGACLAQAQALVARHALAPVELTAATRLFGQMAKPKAFKFIMIPPVSAAAKP